MSTDRAEHLADELADAETDGRSTDAQRIAKHAEAEREAAGRDRGEAAAEREQQTRSRHTPPKGRRRAAPGST
jgi:hypothetical protein